MEVIRPINVYRIYSEKLINKMKYVSELKKIYDEQTDERKKDVVYSTVMQTYLNLCNKIRGVIDTNNIVYLNYNNEDGYVRVIEFPVQHKTGDFYSVKYDDKGDYIVVE